MPGPRSAGGVLACDHERSLRALRALLRPDYLTGADWKRALVDAARLTAEALGAREALVAIWEPDGRWSAITSQADEIAGRELPLIASLTVLEQVRERGEPVLAREELPALLRSRSARRHELRSVLAAPFHWWNVGTRGPVQTFAGCLYADRRRDQPPFETVDVDLFVDLASLTERTLNLVRHVGCLEGRVAELAQEVELTHAALASAREPRNVASEDPRFVHEVIGPLERAAAAGRVGVLLLGPTGAGKTRLAEHFHQCSPRRHGPFVTLDCSQVTSAESLAAELFGYAPRSGFVGAPPEGRPGKARLADGGTLFLDEVGSLPVALQPRLLRVIETGSFAPLGGSQDETSDVVVVAATGEDLERHVRAGTFRADLYFRLAEVVLRVPSLDERPQDLPRFARAFLAAATARFGRLEITGFTPAALARLHAVRWSAAGNLRGLQHAVARSVLLAPADRHRLEEEDLRLPAAPSAAPSLLRPDPPGATEELTAFFEERLETHRGILARLAEDPEVARRLGVPPGRVVPVSTLRQRLRQLGLEGAIARSRAGAVPELEAVLSALSRHGSAAAAARELGLSRDQLVWRLRQAGLTVRSALARRV